MPAEVKTLKAEFKVSEKGFWLYKVREVRLSQAVVLAPFEIERLAETILDFVESQRSSGLLKQVAGSLDNLGSLLELKVSCELPEVVEQKTYLATKFDSYRDLILFNSVSQKSDFALLNGLSVSQIVRQVGLSFTSLRISLKVYSAKSKISKWFKVPKEEGQIYLNLSKSDLTCIVTLGNSAEEWCGDFVVSLFKFIFEILGMKIDNFEQYLDFTKNLQKV